MPPHRPAANRFPHHRSRPTAPTGWSTFARRDPPGQRLGAEGRSDTGRLRQPAARSGARSFAHGRIARPLSRAAQPRHQPLSAPTDSPSHQTPAKRQTHIGSASRSASATSSAGIAGPSETHNRHLDRTHHHHRRCQVALGRLTPIGYGAIIGPTTATTAASPAPNRSPDDGAASILGFAITVGRAGT